MFINIEVCAYNLLSIFPDVNEYFLGTFSCPASQTCSNTPGDYICVCPTGEIYSEMGYVMLSCLPQLSSM